MVDMHHICYPFTRNIGDDVQNIPLMLTVASKVKLIPRESIEQNVNNIKKLMLHGWISRNSFGTFNYSSFASNSASLSIHIADQRHLEGNWKDFFANCQHVYTRDLYTLELMRSAGIKAKFSGCLTMLYGDLFNGASDQGYILCTERKYLNKLKGHRVIYHDPTNTPRYIQFNTAMRIAFTLAWISVIANASMVVSDRLHTLMPAVSLGKRVIFPNIEGQSQPTGPICRFSGLKEIFMPRKALENRLALKNILENYMYKAMEEIGIFRELGELRSSSSPISDCKAAYEKVIAAIDMTENSSQPLEQAYHIGHRMLFDTVTFLGFRSFDCLPLFMKEDQTLVESITDPLISSSIKNRDRDIYWIGEPGSKF